MSINAEDWRRNFGPSPGTLKRWRPPMGDGIRIDSHAYEAYAVPPYYDSMIGKLIVCGRDRADAIDRAERALADFACDGLTTTLDFHRELVRDGAFRSDIEKLHTRWVENDFLPRKL